MGGTPFPHGTISFLFTDIEGSTREWERDATGMQAALARQEEILREAIEAHGGVVFKTIGDAFCAAFASASAALAAALDAQRGLSDVFADGNGPSRVRMSVHAGEAESRDSDYFGRAVNRVARLLSIGHGGQVLLSGSVSELVHGSLPEGASVRDLGEHRLKDLERPERVFQLEHPELRAHFPPLRSLDARPHNLPLQLTSFVGREAEIAEIEQLLGTRRLVTLTGAGGSGKTRLALQAGAEMLDEFPDGVWFVDLSSLTDPELIPQTVAGALGVREMPGREVAETLADHLRPKNLLILLDNCEHLIDKSAEWVESTLRGAPALKILATSREGLGSAGEAVWVVPSLSVPAASDLAGLELLPEIDRYEAIRLFTDRAKLVEPRFELTAEDARPVAMICRRLDGIPLAIELAAARVRVLAPEQIAARLDDRFRLLAGGRQALPRHQTLQAAIDWSHDLLEERERVLLRRASVFSGGWSLEAAESVCADPADSEDSEGELDVAEILDLLSRLVEKSLVSADRAQRTGVRYRMLETTRQYALDRLVAAGESETLRSRHAAWCLGLVERVREESAKGEAPRFESIDPEYDNMRAAMDWCLETPDETWTGFRIAIGLMTYWRRSGLMREGIDRLERALAATADRADPERARGFAAVSALAYFRGDMALARQTSDQALGLAGVGSDDESRLLALVSASRVDLHSTVEAERQRGLQLTERGIALAREMGHRGAEMVLTVALGEKLRGEEDLEGARRKYEEALSLVRGEARVAILFNLGQVAVELGDANRAEEWYREGHTIAGKVGDRMGWVYVILGMGQAAAVRSRHVRAVRLLAAASAAFEKFGERPNPFDQRIIDHAVSRCREALGEEAHEKAWTAGRAMDLERALEEAFGSGTSIDPTSPTGAPPESSP